MAPMRVLANGDLVLPVPARAGGMRVADAGCGPVQYSGGTDAELGAASGDLTWLCDELS